MGVLRVYANNKGAALVPYRVNLGFFQHKRTFSHLTLCSVCVRIPLLLLCLATTTTEGAIERDEFCSHS